ncbi:MAG TPA: ABC transporter permease [Longimicrobiaceae bacterium]
MRTLRFLLRKEFLQIVRDPVLLRLILIMPLVQLLILAHAVTFEVRSAGVYVIDHDRSETSRELVDRLLASGRFHLVGASASRVEADEAMLNGAADAILVFPSKFEAQLVRSGEAPAQLILDAEDGAAAAVIGFYASRIIDRYAMEVAAERSPSAYQTTYRTGVRSSPFGEVGPRLEVRRRGWYNPEMDYRAYMVPGILVVLVTLIGSLLTALNIVREKEAGTLEQLNVTPVSRSAFIAAKLIPLWTFAMVDLALGLAFAWAVLGVPVRGSLLLIFFSASVYLVLALGIGLWISTVVETQQQAMFLTFALMMVYLLMSGLFTPLRSMPTWAEWLAQLNPLAHFVHLMRAVLLKGAGLADVSRQLAILGAGGATVLALAVRQYRKRSG